MIFDETTRALNSNTGYFKFLEDGSIYDHTIYIGKDNKPENYVEITKKEYFALLLESEAKANETN